PRSSPGGSWTATTTPPASPRSTSWTTSRWSEPGGARGSCVVLLELRESRCGLGAQPLEIRAEVLHPAAEPVRLHRDPLLLPMGEGAGEQRMVAGGVGDAPPRHRGAPGAHDAAHQSGADADDRADLAVGGDPSRRDRL